MSSKQKILTNEEIDASKRLRRIWEAKKRDLGLTQLKAAKYIGVKTQGGVGHFLNERSALTMETLLAFSALLKVSPDEIYPKLAKKILNILFAIPQQEEGDIQALKDYYMKADTRGREYILERAKIEAERNIDSLPGTKVTKIDPNRIKTFSQKKKPTKKN